MANGQRRSKGVVGGAEAGGLRKWPVARGGFMRFYRRRESIAANSSRLGILFSPHPSVPRLLQSSSWRFNVSPTKVIYFILFFTARTVRTG